MTDLLRAPLDGARRNAAGDPGSSGKTGAMARNGLRDPGARRRKGRWWAVGLGLLALAGAGAAAWEFARDELAEAGAAATALPPPTVTVSQPLYREIVEWDEYTGQFAAVDYVEVRARVSGYLDSIHFEDGQIVKKGDLLFVIDPRPFEIALASARAQLYQAEAQLEFADRQLARAGELLKNDFVSQSTYDERAEANRPAPR